MINHFWTTFGLARMSQFDLVVLIGSLYVTCAFAGVILDLLLTDAAFGAVVNGFLLFMFLLTVLVIYNETIEHVRLSKSPVLLLGVSMGLSSTLLLLLALGKNRLSRDD